MMIALAPKPVAFELRVRPRGRAQSAPGDHVSIWATEDGYSLVAPDGRVLFRGLGREGRHQCLEFAREHGVLVVYS
jgi:hypothetical protein